MLTVTHTARKRLTCKLTNKNAAQDQALRFTRQVGGWKLCLDQIRPEDTVFSHDGKCVLLLDKTVSREMSDMVLDASSTASGDRLKLSRHPEDRRA